MSARAFGVRVWLAVLLACEPATLHVGDESSARCDGGATACPGPGGALVCTDLDADPDHCGACGERCARGLCAAGHCCLGEHATVCDTAGGPRCVDPDTDPEHCGACGASCRGGPCVGGRCCEGVKPAACTVDGARFCVDFDSDAQHCGACSTPCAQGACIDGACCTHPCAGGCLPTHFDVVQVAGEQEAIGTHGRDVDMDGLGDALYAHQLSGTLHIFWGNRQERLAERAVLASGRIGVGLDVGDVNEDGHLDVVASIQGEGPPLADRIRVFPGQGERRFGEPFDLTQGDNPGWVALLDANADGHIDLAVRLPGRACTALRFGDGGGGFTEARCVVPHATIADHESLRRVDLDEDGRDELLDVRASGLWVHSFDDSGNVIRSDPLDIELRAEEVMTYDIDRQGEPELVAFERFGTRYRAFVVAPEAETLEVCEAPEQLAIADGFGPGIPRGVTDFNGDGILDVVVRTTCGYCSSNLYLLLGRTVRACEALGDCPVK